MIVRGYLERLPQYSTKFSHRGVPLMMTSRSNEKAEMELRKQIFCNVELNGEVCNFYSYDIRSL